MKKKVKNNYVDNKKLYGEMLHFITLYNEAKEAALPKDEYPRVSNYIGQCISLIAHNLAKKPNFSNYSFVDEMIFDGIENCLMYLHNFDPDKTKNPFAYFTTIIFYAFIRRIKKEEKQRYIKYKLMNHMSITNSLSDSPEDWDSITSNLLQIDDDKAYALVEKFEPKAAQKKLSKKKGVELFIEEDLDNEQTDTHPGPADD
jgi:hypothetical protein